MVATLKEGAAEEIVQYMDRDYLFRAMANYLAVEGLTAAMEESRKLLEPLMVYSEELVDVEDLYGPTTDIRLTERKEGGSNMARSGDTPFERSLQDTIIRRLNEDKRTLVRCRSADAVGHFVGDPDITGCIGGRHVEIEVKVPGEVPTRLQLIRLSYWRKVGACAVWVNSTEQALEFQETVLAQSSEDRVLGPGPGPE
jgi:hypothetical protein